MVIIASQNVILEILVGNKYQKMNKVSLNIMIEADDR